MRDSVLEFYGMAEIFVVTAALTFLIQQAVKRVEVVQVLPRPSPWEGANARPRSWIVAGVVFFTAVAIPPVLVFKDGKDGRSRLEALGFAGWTALLIASLGYLLSVGWYGAKYLVAHG